MKLVDLFGKPRIWLSTQQVDPGFSACTGIFRTLRQVISGSQDVIKELNEIYDIYIVSAAMEFTAIPDGEI
jgi:5'(3')-deoxyribonucleotidase